ncbi:MAG: HAMP domain-containing histidine kinase [Actinomycetes bacterium]|jgi:signal transduction histidine kinase|nr:HAMP domain-containing histidine kinase [Actinomycetes bacterium]
MNARARTRHARRRASIFASRIGFAFAIVAAVTAVLAGVITWFVWSWQFENYIKANLQDTADTVAEHASEAYQTYGGWNFLTLPVIPQVATRVDVAVQILDQNGRIIYDDATMRASSAMLSGIDPSLLLDTPINLDPGKESVMSSPIYVGNYRVGEVRVWAFGSGGLLSVHDLQMRNSSLLALGVAGFIAIVTATAAGVAYARRWVRPINRITQTARALRAGDEDARTELTGDDEIAQLGMTFDKMADSIQNDRRLERRLTSDVAHELRTPLMGIQATIEAIEDGIYPADAAHLQVVTNETRRLSRLTDGILMLSHLENADPDTFRSDTLDVADIVHATVDAHAALFEAAGLQLVVNLTPQLFVAGDRDKLQQALGNLLSNAARYTPEGGTVTVQTELDKTGEYVRTSVGDTGIGISAGDMGKLFSRFWRADAARSRVTGGIGIGLSIVKEIVDRHRGTVEVESVEGEGTTFTIVLPRVRRPS